MASFLDATGVGYLWNKLMDFMSSNIPTAAMNRIGGFTAYEITSVEHPLYTYSVLEREKGGRTLMVEIYKPQKEYNLSNRGVVYVPPVTNICDGLITSTDKKKLDAIEDNANNYSLPVASSEELGGIKTNYTQNGRYYPLNVNADGNGYVHVPWTDTTYGVATTSADGLMPKLPTEPYYGWYGGNVFTPDMQFIGGDGKWKSLDIKFEGNKIKLCTCDEDSYYGEISAEVPLAGSNINGLMSKEDKNLLDGFHSVMNENGAFILTETGVPGAYSWDEVENQMSFSSHNVYGNWFTGDRWEFTDGNIFTLPDIPAATPTTGGVMSSSDKVKLDVIDTETLPFVIEINGTLSNTNSWLNLSADVYAKLTEQTFKQPVFLKSKTSFVNTLIPATVYVPFNSNRLYMVFAEGSGEFCRLTITLDSSTNKATSVTGKSFVPTWE